MWLNGEADDEAFGSGSQGRAREPENGVRGVSAVMQADEREALTVARLREAGLRPTRQRLALGRILFHSGDRHLTAEDIFAEAEADGAGVSLATVYNTLNQFTAAGLLREVVVEGGRTYFDTNVSDHHHFYVQDESRLIDIEGGTVKVTGLPEAPDGTALARVDVIVRVRKG